MNYEIRSLLLLSQVSFLNHYTNVCAVEFPVHQIFKEQRFVLLIGYMSHSMCGSGQEAGTQDVL